MRSVESLHNAIRPDPTAREALNRFRIGKLRNQEDRERQPNIRTQNTIFAGDAPNEIARIQQSLRSLWASRKGKEISRKDYEAQTLVKELHALTAK